MEIRKIKASPQASKVLKELVDNKRKLEQRIRKSKGQRLGWDLLQDAKPVPLNDETMQGRIVTPVKRDGVDYLVKIIYLVLTKVFVYLLHEINECTSASSPTQTNCRAFCYGVNSIYKA